MTPEIEDHIIALLRGHRDFTMSLAELHRKLAARFGREVGTVHVLRESLARRPETFLVFDPPWGTWNHALPGPALRSEVENALRTAGLEAGPQVVLLQLPPPSTDAVADAADEVFERIRATLVPVLAQAAQGSDLHAVVVEALTEASLLRRALAESSS